MAPQNTRAPSAASPALLSHPQICGVVYHLLSAGSGYLCCKNAVLPNAPRHEPALFFMPLNGPGPKPSDKRTVPGPIDEVPSLSLRNSRATAFIPWSAFLCSFRAVSSNQLTIYNKRDPPDPKNGNKGSVDGYKSPLSFQRRDTTLPLELLSAVVSLPLTIISPLVYGPQFSTYLLVTSQRTSTL